jgi:Cdc6-like AAA superfamily ATPase
MENVVIRVINRVVHILGDFRPGSLLETSSGAKLLVVSRRKGFHEKFIELISVVKDLNESIETVSISKALVVSEKTPEPGETVRPYNWPQTPGVYSPEGEVDLLHAKSGIPHLAVIGSTGVGKTTLVKHIVSDAAKRGFRVVVLDAHGEYGELVQKLGGVAGPPRIAICELSDQELLSLTGLIRVQSPIRMMRYIRYFVDAFCDLAKRINIGDIYKALHSCTEAMMMLDKLSPNQKMLDEQDNLKIEFVSSLINTAGKVTFNALREIVKRDEERVAATMMYLLWAADAAQLQLFNSEMPKITAINLFEAKNIFMTSDVALAVISFILRKLIEMREPSVVVIEEAARLTEDETAKRVIYLALAKARKFGVKLVLVSQKAAEYVQNTRIVAGRIQNVEYAKQIAALAPHMPGEIARLLPQLSVGEFVYIDRDVMPIRVIL